MATNNLIEWDKVGEHFFESGNDHGVLYQIDNEGKYADGVAWNGLTAVNSTPGGAEANELWADNIKYAVLRSAETYGGTIECYTYPDEFKQNNGEESIISDLPGVVASGQSRKAFGFSYRTNIGNDLDGTDHSYKLHLVYNATVTPSERAYQTLNDSPDAITMSFEFETTPVSVKGTTLKKPTAHIEIDASKMKTETELAFLAAVEKNLYGFEDTEDPSSKIEPWLPLPSDLVEIYNEVAGNSNP